MLSVMVEDFGGCYNRVKVFYKWDGHEFGEPEGRL